MIQPLRYLPVLLTVLITLPILAQDPCRPAAELAGAILDGAVGDLPIDGHYVIDEAALDEGRLVVTIAARLDVAAITARRGARLDEICVALILNLAGELAVEEERRIEIPELADPDGVAAWHWAARLELPEDAAEILVLVQEPRLGTWGAFVADDTGAAAPRPGPTSVSLTAQRGAAWYEIEHAPEARRGNRRGPLVRLIPPRSATLEGPTRFEALSTSPVVARVRFELDGEEISVERRSPFVARLPLDRPAREQTVRAVALDADGRELGDDVLVVNLVDLPFRVRITEWQPREGAVEVAAEVTLPAEAELERVELFRNEELVATFKETSLRTRIALPRARPDDFIRVAAFLVDGASIDDVVLLSSPGPIEEVEVNLVEFHAVVTDRAGEPVVDLEASDFSILESGVEREIASFAYAEDVPLLLGLVIDTSGSMQLVMHDTKRAAAKFIGQTVLPQDRAFLVDFDRRPRLLQDTTDDVVNLLMSLGQLEAEGLTAMYDAIVFSMLQFERQPGRKALVVLTDGDDRESRYGPRDSAELAERLGVPIYIIGLGELDILRRVYPKKDLERVTSRTGGRFWLVNSLEELAAAYDQINAELRSQYSIRFYADRDLSDEERRRVEVKVRGGLETRTVLGATRLD